MLIAKIIINTLIIIFGTIGLDELVNKLEDNWGSIPIFLLGVFWFICIAAIVTYVGGL